MGSWGRFLKAVAKREWKFSGLTWAGFAATAIYVISPIDFLSEAVFFLVGYVDDIGIWGVSLLLLTREKQRWEESLKVGAIDL